MSLVISVKVTLPPDFILGDVGPLLSSTSYYFRPSPNKACRTKSSTEPREPRMSAGPLEENAVPEATRYIGGV